MSATDEVRDLITEAADWLLVSLLFQRPRPGWRTELRLLLDDFGDRKGADLGRRAEREGLEPVYLALLGPGGHLSPRETAYHRMADPGRILAQLNHLYEAFGYAPSAEDPPDHVAVIAGFLGFLRLKEGYARARADAEHTRIVRDAAQLVLREHLGFLAVGLSDRLSPIEDHYLVAASTFLVELVGPAAEEIREQMARERDAPVPGNCEDGCGLAGGA